MTGRPPGGTGGAASRPIEWLVAAGLVVLAAALRLVGLPGRGEWDADQGNQVLALLHWVRDGQLPLLGPLTSIGTFHHGALFYWLLAPAAFASDADPTAIVGEIALAGSLAVLPAWWLARSIAGPVAGLVAGVLLALSAAAIDESTFVWNPNVVALPAALALACAWKAWTGGRARWWLVAAACASVVAQCHILGLALPIALAPLLIADGARRAGPERRRVAAVGLGCALVVAAGFLPTLAFDLGHDFTELRGMAGFLLGVGGAGPSGGSSWLLRLTVVPLRVLAWPLTGLILNGPGAPLPAVGAATLVVASAAWRIRAEAHGERAAMGWLAATLVVGTAILAVAAGSLTTVVEALPVDHYHAFLDPAVVVVAGIGLARLVAVAGPGGRLAGGGVLIALVAWNAAHWPPLVAPDGGYPAAERAAERILAEVDRGAPIGTVSLPDFKSADAYALPLERDGARLVSGTPDAPPATTQLVVLCDQLFRESIGADCGGPAEEGVVASSGASLRDRFEAAPGRFLSVYAVPAR